MHAAGRLAPVSTWLWAVCLAGIAGGQIVIPPGVIPDKPRTVGKPRKPATAPAPKDKTGRKPSLGKLLGEFRRASGKGDQREKIAAQVLELGPIGARTLGGIVTRELSRRRAAYTKDFYGQARRVGMKKQRSVDRKRALQHRKQFQALHNNPAQITEKTLKSIAGPALTYLRDAMIVKRDEVLKANKSLTARREEILSLDRIASACRKTLDVKPAAGGGKDAPATLKQQETLIALLCTAMTRDERKIMESDFKRLAKLDFQDSHALLYLNIIRLLLGVRPMQTDLKLCEAALGHSIGMHEPPVEGKKTPTLLERVKLAGTQYNTACIIEGGAGIAAINMCFLSPGHHNFVMSKSSRAGIGGYKGKWTLLTGN